MQCMDRDCLTACIVESVAYGRDGVLHARVRACGGEGGGQAHDRISGGCIRREELRNVRRVQCNVWRPS